MAEPAVDTSWMLAIDNTRARAEADMADEARRRGGS